MYTDDAIREAFLRDERERLALLAESEYLPGRISYEDAYLTGGQVDYTPTFDDIDRAVVELAGQRGQDYAQTWAQVRALAAGENDTSALADAVVALAQVPEGQTVTLTADNISAAERQLLAKRGHALPDGSYPIRHAKDLHSAAILAASGHGDHVSAHRLIKKRARELGIDHTKLPGFGSGPSNTGGSDSMGSGGGAGEGPSGGGGTAMSAGMRRAGLTPDIIRLAARDGDADDEGTVSRIVRENPHLFGKPGAKKSGPRVITRARDEDPTDTRHPRPGGVTHPEVARYLAMLGTAGGREKPSGSVKSYGHRNYVPPGPSGKPQNRA